MKRFAILTTLALIALQAGFTQDSKPDPLPFHQEITPVESLAWEMHSLPIVIERLYALYERNRNEKSVQEADKQLINMLRLEMKGLFSGQQRALEFSALKPENRRFLPTALLDEYHARVKSGWYKDMQSKYLSADQIVDLLNSERQSWMMYFQNQVIDSTEESSEPFQRTPNYAEGAAPPVNIHSKDSHTQKAPFQGLSTPEPKASTQAPIIKPPIPMLRIIFYGIVIGFLIAGFLIYLLKTKK